MKLLSLFSGIGAFEKALNRLYIPYELVGFSEIDKYAVQSYCAIHGVDESKNLGDITEVDEKALPKDIDLVTYGFPCQDISLAGKQKGLFNEDGTQTRSGLFFEALRIIEATQPRVAIAENVKNLTSKKFETQFQIVLDSLEQAGYNNYWQVLNAKDYGIPQNRERVFIVSIRKDIDTGCFRFPERFPLEIRLKDMLEDVVDEKYYITTTASQKLMQQIAEKYVIQDREVVDGTVNEPKVKDVANCIKARYDSGVSNFKSDGIMVIENQPILVGGMQKNQSVKTDGISPTMDSCSGGNRMPKVLVKEATKQGYAEAFEGDSINLEQPNSKTRRGRVGHGVAQTLTTAPQQAVVERETISYTRMHPAKQSDVSVCIQAGYSKGFSNNNPYPAVREGLRIRKLTPKECFRLMNFDDADFEKAEAVNSNTQLYKQAGNSIVVAVPYYIITALYDANIFNEKENTEMERCKIGFNIPDKRASLDDVLQSLSYYQWQGCALEVVNSYGEENGCAFFDIEMKPDTVFVLVHDGAFITVMKKER